LLSTIFRYTCNRWRRNASLTRTIWTTFEAPARTPSEVVEVLNRGINKVLGDPELARALCGERDICWWAAWPNASSGNSLPLRARRPEVGYPPKRK
jgi:hypothetical protein